MRVVAISDVHSNTVDLPEGDLLIVAGDLTGTGTRQQVKAFNNYIRSQRSKFKSDPLVVAGNHDFLFQDERQVAEQLLDSAIYLEDETIEIEGLRVHGSPWTPTFMSWAFMRDRGAQIMEKWTAIPENLDILITHGPPMGVLDYGHGKNLGCKDLFERVSNQLARPPRVHVFGHIHEGYGRLSTETTDFYNVSVCTIDYRPINPPTVFEI